MKRNMQQPILNLDGSEAKNEKNEVVMLSFVSITALLSMDPQEQTTAENKAKRYRIAMKINAHPDDVNVTAEEVAIIKECIGKLYSPLVVGRAFDLLEQELKTVEAAV